MRRLVIIGSAYLAAVGCSASASADGAVVKGRVVDSAGWPVADAEVRIWRKTKVPDGTLRNEPARFSDLEVLHTDEVGQFVSPDVMEPTMPVRLFAQADGMLAGRSGWVLPAQQVTDVDDIVLRRLTSVQGRVVDSNGAAVEGASVFNSGDGHVGVESQTDAAGEFKLDGVPEGTIFLFAEKRGYRFAGMVCIQPDANRIVMAREDENVEPLRMRQRVLSRAERVALAHRLLDPYLDVVTRQHSSERTGRAFSALVSCDPEAAWHYLDTLLAAVKLNEGQYREFIVSEWMGHEFADDWDKIQSLLESSVDNDRSADWLLRGATLFLLKSDRTRIREWLNLGVARARASASDERRLCLFGMAAEGFWRLGDRERATAMAREVEAKLKQWRPDPLFVDGYARLAKALAPADLPAALDWLDRISDDSQFAFEGSSAAILLASINPEQAEEVWDHIDGRPAEDRSFIKSRDMRAAEFCAALARNDVKRAERIASALRSPLRRLQALLSVAGEAEAQAARPILAKATAIARSQDLTLEDEYWGSSKTRAEALALSLPVAERIDATLVRELLWRAISLRDARPTIGVLDDEDLFADIALAQLVARFDSDAARSLLAPAVQQLPQTLSSADVLPWRIPALFHAAAFVDPNWAIELMDGLPPPRDASAQQPKNAACLSIVEILGLGDVAYRRYGFRTWYRGGALQ